MPWPLDENRPRRRGPNGPSRDSSSLASRANLVTTVITGIVAVAAFVLSMINYSDANAEPEVTMTLPAIVRFTGVPNSGAFFAIQPTFALLKASSKSAVVTEMSLDLQPPPGSDVKVTPRLL